MAQQFNYAVYQERLSRLEAKTRALLKETNNTELTRKMDSELAGLQDRKELRLAFVGQYSSGKSTIISALTGRKDCTTLEKVEWICTVSLRLVE